MGYIKSIVAVELTMGNSKSIVAEEEKKVCSKSMVAEQKTKGYSKSIVVEEQAMVSISRRYLLTKPAGLLLGEVDGRSRIIHLW